MTDRILGFVGDLLVNRPSPCSAFQHVREVLRCPRILFGNLEGIYTDKGMIAPSAPSVATAPWDNISAFKEVGFDVLSLANNHVLDVGYDALRDNLDRLRADGIQICGAGNTIAEARAPAILQCDSTAIAYLAYASTFPKGYESTPDRPGLAPMRAYNFWRDANPNIHAPGRRPLAMTVADEVDLANLRDDIERSKQCADLVIVSFHWGDVWQPFHLTDHERRTARQCIDAGADIVVGHHHHVLRGFEWYRGKPIFYGLGHFVFDVRLDWDEAEFAKRLLHADPTLQFRETDFAPGPREGWPLLPMHEDCRLTMLGWVAVTDRGVGRAGFVACKLQPDGSVRPFGADDAEAKDVIRYLQQCNETQGLATAITADQAPEIGGIASLLFVER